MVFLSQVENDSPTARRSSSTQFWTITCSCPPRIAMPIAESRTSLSEPTHPIPVRFLFTSAGVWSRTTWQEPSKHASPRDSTMRTGLIAIALALSASACTYSKVRPYGPDTYVALAESGSAIDAKSAAIDEANEKCDSLGLKMMPDSEHESTGWNARVGATKKEVQLIFRCLKETDPAYQRPVMRPQGNDGKR